MRPDRMTTKSREAFQDGIARASRFGNPELQPEHLLAAMIDQEGGVGGPLLQKAGADASALRAAVARKVEGLPAGHRRRRARPVPPHAGGHPARRRGGEAAEGRVRVRRALPARHGPSRSRREGAPRTERWSRLREAAGRAGQRARHPAHHRPRSRGQVPGAGEVLPRPHRRRSQGKDGPGGRPRRGDPSRDAGPLPADEEQPGAHRRAGRGKDRHRRGDRATHRARRRAGVAEEQEALRAGHGGAGGRRQVPRRVRGATEGGPQGDRGIARADRALHRRASHHRGCGRRRGGDGCREPAEARPRARRAAMHRRDHARRVPQAHREGPGAGATVPARLRLAAHGRRYHRHPSRAEGALRSPSRHPHPGCRSGRRRDAQRPIRARPLPSGQGHRPGRRSRRQDQDGSRQHARGDRRHPAQDDAAADRSAGAEEGARPGEQGSPGGRQAPDRRARGEHQRHARPVAARAARSSSRSARSSPRSRPFVTRRRKRSAPAIWEGRRRSPTGESPSWRSASRRRGRPWRRSRRRRATCAKR